MKRHKMQNFGNVFLINDFREKYGLSQHDLAGLLGVNRGQLSHTKISARPLPLEAERKFIALSESIQSEVEEQGDQHVAKLEQESRDKFLWRSNHKLIAMQHQAHLLEKELPRLQKREKELLSVIKSWDELSESAKSLLAIRHSADTIKQKNLAKLAKCDIGVQLEKKAEIQILLAGAEALKIFLEDYKISQESKMPLEMPESSGSNMNLPDQGI